MNRIGRQKSRRNQTEASMYFRVQTSAMDHTENQVALETF